MERSTHTSPRWHPYAPDLALSRYDAPAYLARLATWSDVGQLQAGCKDEG